MPTKCVRNFFDEKKRDLYEIIKYAKNNVSYYSRIYPEIVSYEDFDFEFFSKLPVITKKDILNYPNEFIARGVDKNALFAESTSGSSGEVLYCYKSIKEKNLLAINLWKYRRKLIPDLTPNDKMVHFFMAKRKNDEIINEGYFYNKNILEISMFDLSEETIKVFWNEIIEFKPKWMHGLPSVMFRIATVIDKYNLPKINIPFIELTGEFANDEVKMYIKKTFNCLIGDEYGSREFWLIAYGCDNGTFHINSEYIFLSYINSFKSSNNEILITSLKNKTWPLIKYRIGDYGQLDYNNCPCGGFESSYILKLLGARASESCSFKGVVISKVLFSYIIRNVNKINREAPIKQYQVIKKSDDKVLIKLVTDNMNIQYDILQELKKYAYLNNIRFDFERVEFIDVYKETGKLKEFIDESE